MVLVRISAGDRLREAMLCSVTMEVIMNSDAGMPLPLTSAITRQR